jgi:hypothetical protein
MFEVLREHFKLSPDQMHSLIRSYHARTVSALAAKGINYSDLKSALVPQRDRREVALIFNLTGNESWYSYAFSQVLLPLLHRASSRAVLHGDIFAHTAESQRTLHAILAAMLLPSRPQSLRPGMQYAIYINNLTKQMIDQMHTGFLGVSAYAGYVDMTYQSPLKSYLSTLLPQAFLQHRDVIIGPHEGGRSDAEDVNLIGFSFEEAGFRLRSIVDDSYGVLLTYKIERPVLRGYEVDTEFSLNAVHRQPLPLTDFEIILEEEKFGYLAHRKAESLRQAGLLNGGAESLKRLIKAKIAENYIYSMTYLPEHGVTKFNVIIEAEPSPSDRFRLLCGLAYLADGKSLRVITLF